MEAERTDHLLGALAPLDDSLDSTLPNLSQGGVGELAAVETRDASFCHKMSTYLRSDS